MGRERERENPYDSKFEELVRIEYSNARDTLDEMLNEGFTLSRGDSIRCSVHRLVGLHAPWDVLLVLRNNICHVLECIEYKRINPHEDTISQKELRPTVAHLEGLLKVKLSQKRKTV